TGKIACPHFHLGLRNYLFTHPATGYEAKMCGLTFALTGAGQGGFRKPPRRPRRPVEGVVSCLPLSINQILHLVKPIPSAIR
ncbi:MAG: hypothetical protein L0312_29310, partial [Acidobacteria bacterium]|nr:hypothetical protein [Acidobacteriota bacterium]